MRDPQRQSTIDRKSGDGTFDLSRVAGYLSYALEYYLLLGLILIALLFAGLGVYLVVPPRYTARAVIGPPGPSPVTSMVASQSAGTSLGSSITRRLGGGGSATNDPFQEYLQLLRSYRLAKVLAEKDKMLPWIFYKSWDAKNHRWQPKGALHRIKNSVLRLFNQPVHDFPNVDELHAYLLEHLTVSESAGDAAKSLINSDSSYMVVTFDFDDPNAAQSILATIINEADSIIREETKRDVVARVSYLQAELPRVTDTEQRQSFISILSEQEQMKMMLSADNRYATTLVDGPHSMDIPTFPPAPARLFVTLALFGVTLWGLLLYIGTTSERLQAVLSKFRRGRQQRVTRIVAGSGESIGAPEVRSAKV